VEKYRAKYEAISDVLEDNPEVISLAHRDWSRMLSVSSVGRQSGYTSEQMLRALIVMFVEGAVTGRWWFGLKTASFCSTLWGWVPSR
jgi:hypothetical protein